MSNEIRLCGSKSTYSTMPLLAYCTANCAIRSHINYLPLVQCVSLQIGVMRLCICGNQMFMSMREPNWEWCAFLWMPTYALPYCHVTFCFRESFMGIVSAWEFVCWLVCVCSSMRVLRTKAHPSIMWARRPIQAHVIPYQLPGSSLELFRSSSELILRLSDILCLSSGNNGSSSRQICCGINET